MIIYWDAVVLFNTAVDYLLLFAAARLCGWEAARGRLAAAALVGGVGAVAVLLYPAPVLWSALLPLVMCAVAYGGSGRALRLTVLFFLCCCMLGGSVLLLAQTFGSVQQLSRTVAAAEIPWAVFFGAGAGCYLLLCCVFRGSAKVRGGDFVRAQIRCGEKSVELRLLRDTGNLLTDPKTGQGVPVVERRALAALELPAERESIAYCALGTAGGSLEAFRCDGLILEGRDLGERLIALSPMVFPDCCGLWCGREEQKG